MIQVLENLFDSPIKVRMLKLFLRNPEQWFRAEDVSARTKSNLKVVQAQIFGLVTIGLLKAREVKGRKNQRKDKPVPGEYYIVNPAFDFYEELKTLVLKSSPASKDMILEKLKKLGRLKVVVLGGIFLNTDNKRADIFIVGDRIRKAPLDAFLTHVEAEVGKEIDYVVMDAKEFNYRLSMFDKFVMDFFDRPHEVLIDKLGVQEKFSSRKRALQIVSRT